MKYTHAVVMSQQLDETGRRNWCVGRDGGGCAAGLREGVLFFHPCLPKVEVHHQAPALYPPPGLVLPLWHPVVWRHLHPLHYLAKHPGKDRLLTVSWGCLGPFKGPVEKSGSLLPLPHLPRGMTGAGCGEGWWAGKLFLPSIQLPAPPGGPGD